MPTKFWFTPTKTTEEMRAQLGNPKFNYELACNQVCGRGHFAKVCPSRGQSGYEAKLEEIENIESGSENEDA